jgi:hypothetical protein
MYQLQINGTYQPILCHISKQITFYATSNIDSAPPDHVMLAIRRVWRYQRGNQNQYIEEEQTTQWRKEKVQKDKQRSTKHTHKTKDRLTRTPLKTGGELRCSGRGSSSCSTSGTCRVNLVTNPVMNEERTRKCLRQVKHIGGHLWHRYSITVNQVMVATVKLSKWWLQLNQEEPLVQ